MSRAAHIRAATVLALLATFVGSAQQPAAAADPEITPGSRATVAVTVATLWRKPGLLRARDRTSGTDPVDLTTWNQRLRTASQRRWLVLRIRTQALYNQEVHVREVRRGWARVAVIDEPDPRDPLGYPGWMPLSQLEPGAPDPDPDVVVRARKTRLLVGNTTIPVSYGTRLSTVGADGEWTIVSSPHGEGRIPAQALEAPPAPTPQGLLAAGRRFLGVRYLWGGLSSWGFDCSGLVWSLFRAHGRTIPRDADPQFRSGQRVRLAAVKPADLLFWGNRRSIHHVALYLGNGMMLEAPNSAGAVQIVPVRRDGLVGARRYLIRTPAAARTGT